MNPYCRNCNYSYDFQITGRRRERSVPMHKIIRFSVKKMAETEKTILILSIIKYIFPDSVSSLRTYLSFYSHKK